MCDPARMISDAGSLEGSSSLLFPRPRSAWLRPLAEAPLRLVEHALGLAEIAAIVSRVEHGVRTKSLADRIVAETGITTQMSDEDRARIPRTGAGIVCCNHPFGGADSVALLTTLLSIRPDVKFLANSMLERIPFLAPNLIFVDPFGGRDAARRNASALRQAIEWLRGGHLIAAFPAGEVSAVRWGQWTPTDPPWSTIPARLALQSRAKLIPAWIEGANGRLFQAAGLVHPRLRTALIPREFVARQGCAVELRIGRPIPTEGTDLDSESLTRLVRGRAELLRRSAPVARAVRALGPVAEPAATREQLAAEIDALPSDRLLYRDGAHAVYAVAARDIPLGLLEIGRLREIVFRAVGEGSGKPRDLDAFDDTYWHIVVWNAERLEIVGAYRAGIVREVAAKRGVDGLYTSTLFRFSPDLLPKLDDAVELGRAIVAPDYQRQALPLSQLWRGIAVFMFRRGLMRMFGPVSISNEYASQSKELMMEFLERHRLDRELSGRVSARNPPARRAVGGFTEREASRLTRDLPEVERMIEEIERGQRAVPVLLRHYLRLNAHVLGFNVDQDFGDAIDALMIVDLRDIDDRIIRHYAGDAGTALVAAWRAMR